MMVASRCEGDMGSCSMGIKLQLHKMGKSRDVLSNRKPIVNDAVLCT